MQPFRMLVEHRVDDVNERFITVEESMASGEEVAFQPALALMLTEHLHDMPGRCKKFVVLDSWCVPLAIGCFKDSGQTI